MKCKAFGTVVAVRSFSLLSVVEAHEERPVQYPSGLGSGPVDRTGGPRRVVCAPDTLERIKDYPGALRAFNRRLLSECQEKGFTSIQEAVTAVTERGTRILIQPGRYEEPSSLVPPTGQCAAIVDKFPLSYAEQQACPHLHHLIALFGDGPDATSPATTRGAACRSKAPAFDLRMSCSMEPFRR